MLYLSLACVGLGSVLSINVVLSKKAKRVENESEDEDDFINVSEALKFPIYATVALLSLYILFKNIDKDFLNLLFKINFGLMGASCIGNMLVEYVPTQLP